MHFEAAGHTNAGRVKETNQDSYCIKIAGTEMGDIALIAVADGMGGLEKGELASATAIKALSTWFEEKIPASLETVRTSVEGFESFVEGQWNGLVQDLNLKIMSHGIKQKMNLGTTLTALLVFGARYSVLHVGDSRVYEITDEEVTQITDDQTFVKREMDAGRMTLEEALVHPQRNALLQCLGSSKTVVPEITHGILNKQATYLLCSDGFRHVLTKDELRDHLCQTSLSNKDRAVILEKEALELEGKQPDLRSLEKCLNEKKDYAKAALHYLTELDMQRKERDNITSVVLYAKED